MLESVELIILLLISSVVFLTLFRYLKLSATIAYFVVGILLGPSAAGFLHDSESVRHFVEFGIVFLMFSIGLEFSLPKLNSMRGILFGLGGAQVLITLATSLFISRLFGLDFTMAFVVGSALTMSSTAIVSKLLIERLDLNSRHGKLSIGILLFQDIAVIPILILIPALSSQSIDINTIFISISLKVILLLSILFWLGKPVMNFWFGLVAKQKSRELFVLNVLMVTMFFAYLTELAGLSYALGAFLAGMLISETRYRYQVESDISSFRDILLGLFFISVGMMLNLNVFFDNFWVILSILFAYTLFKASLIALLTKAFKYEMGVGIRTGVILGQAGEFSFVILALANEQNLIGGEILQIVLSVCLLSMITASFLIPYNGKIARFLSRSYTKNSQKNIDKIDEVGHNLSDHVILCGYGRSGQFLGRFLKEENISFIAIDMDLNRVNDAASAGEKVMYGDASRRVVLNAAGISTCKAVIITYADDRASSKVLSVIRESYLELPIIVRTTDETSIERLQEEGASEVVPEVLEGSLMLGSHALIMLGVPLGRVVKKIRAFRSERYAMFRGYFKGTTDITDDFSGQEQLELHSIEVRKNPLLLSVKLDSIRFEDFHVQIQYLRRPNMLEDIEPRSDILLSNGDTLVILGLQKDINRFEKYLSTGKMIS
ncbi:putative glutathione-regulated potassium-efflux system k+/h+ antiporter transmembrane protein [Methylophilales bacterium HTCC2181]|uniref:Putative glutathione-regulated potassium-efflux system k+/h+ antiporter transmembrane protein n=1 Tax=Methylophilales bacterium HTCC2181 TaxID=383631 RepID=A0P4M6_9PROT|nr:putative glutathione-regulated potassium-efflux system k+/h+ antiporter transmembrane protein [Methylophilales bacterium HTCC2181]